MGRIHSDHALNLDDHSPCAHHMIHGDVGHPHLYHKSRTSRVDLATQATHGGSLATKRSDLFLCDVHDQSN